MRRIAAFSSQSKSDPGALLERQLANRMYPMNLRTDMAEWAATDPDAAVAWFRRNLKNGKLVSARIHASPELHLGSALAAELAKKNPDTAFAIAEEVDSEFQNQVVASTVEVLITTAKEEQTGAQALVAGLTEADGVIVNAAVEAMAKSGKREQVVGFLGQLSLDKREEADALSRVVAIRDKSEESVPQRMGWLIDNASNEARNDAVKLAVSRLYPLEAEATSQWIDTLPRGGLRDSALSSEASKLLGQHAYSDAFGRAMLIQDDARREMKALAIHENWSRRDPEAANRALKAANVQSLQ